MINHEKALINHLYNLLEARLMERLPRGFNKDSLYNYIEEQMLGHKNPIVDQLADNFERQVKTPIAVGIKLKKGD